MKPQYSLLKRRIIAISLLFLKENSLRSSGVELKLLKKTIFEVLSKTSSFTIKCGRGVLSGFSLVLLRLNGSCSWRFGSKALFPQYSIAISTFPKKSSTVGLMCSLRPGLLTPFPQKLKRFTQSCCKNLLLEGRSAMCTVRLMNNFTRTVHLEAGFPCLSYGSVFHWPA